MQNDYDEEAREWERDAEEGKPPGYYDAYVDNTLGNVGCFIIMVLFFMMLFVCMVKR